MLVVAKYVRLDELPASRRNAYVERSFGDGEHRSLRRGAEYVVYAVEVAAEGTLYFVDDGSSYPFAYCAEVFDVVDPRPSRLWPHGAQTVEEWADDEYFYGNLVEVDDDGAAREIFDAAKQVMDFEFVIPSEVKGSALRLDDGWLECTACEHIWHAEAIADEMCLCPRCLELLAFRDRETSR